MRNIKKYEDFVNEEINLRKGLMGAALGASLIGGITSCDNKKTQEPIQYQTPIFSDYELQQRVWADHKSRSQSFIIPFTVKNLPKDIDVKFYNPDTHYSSNQEEVNYFTVYYMLDYEYLRTISDLSKEKIDSLTKLNFEKIKGLIFKNGEPKCVIDFNDRSSLINLDRVRKKLVVSDYVSDYFYLDSDFINMKNRGSLMVNMSDYHLTLLDSNGETSANGHLVPGIYPSKIKVVYTKK